MRSYGQYCPIAKALDVVGDRWTLLIIRELLFRGHWFTFPVSVLLHDRDPAGPPVSIELRTASGPAVIEISGGSARTRPGPAAAPDLILQGEPQLILALFSGQLPGLSA